MNNTHPLQDLAEAIRAKHMEANATAQRAVLLAVEAGQLLIQAKGQVEHGGWSDWLAQNCQFSDRTARTYMSLARRLPGLDDEKRQRVADLPLRQAINELTATKPLKIHEAIENSKNLNDRYRRINEEVGHLRDAIRILTLFNSLPRRYQQALIEVLCKQDNNLIGASRQAADLIDGGRHA